MSDLPPEKPNMELSSSCSMPGSSSSSLHHSYSRKQKSLGLLCTKSVPLFTPLIPFSLLWFIYQSLLLPFYSFLALYNRHGIETIGLDDASSKLGFSLLPILLWFFCFRFRLDLNWIGVLSAGVERRRIYDIVNVLESVGVSSVFF